MSFPPRSVVAVLALVVVAGALPSAREAWAAAASVRIDPSVRAAGMGGASTAVFWSGDVDEWANPALLGYLDGFRYRWTRSEFGSSGAVLGSQRLDYGAGGIGLGGSTVRLDYGRIKLTDNAGNTVGTFAPFERVRPLGLGVSVSRVLRAVQRLRGAEPPSITRHLDVAAGFAQKGVKVALAPDAFQGQASTTTSDAGLLVSARPLPRIAEGRLHVDLAYGFAALNYDHASISFISEDRADRIPPQYRNGFAARMGIPVGMAWAQRLGGWLAPALDPYLTVSLAADFLHFGSGSWGGYDVDQWGLEIDWVHALVVRAGHVTDRIDQVDGYSYGIGVALPIGRLAGVRYDFASYPRTAGTGRWHGHGIGVRVDPVGWSRR